MDASAPTDEFILDTPTVRDTVMHAAGAARAFARGEGADLGSAMAHAWILTGPPGSGRSVAALAFAAALGALATASAQTATAKTTAPAPATVAA